jgi:hypothetical protein
LASEAYGDYSPEDCEEVISFASFRFNWDNFWLLNGGIDKFYINYVILKSDGLIEYNGKSKDEFGIRMRLFQHLRLIGQRHRGVKDVCFISIS